MEDLSQAAEEVGFGQVAVVYGAEVDVAVEVAVGVVVGVVVVVVAGAKLELVVCS